MVKKILLYTLIGIVSLVILVLILLPFVVPSYVEKHSKEWIGRSVSLDKMRLNYFTGTIKLYDFDLYEKDDTTVFVGFDTLIVDTEPYRLFSKTFVIEQFYLQGLFVDVIMYDDGFNFDDLLELGSDSTAVEEEEPPDDSEPMKFEFSEMELSDAMFIIQDAEIQDSIQIDDFDFYLPYLVWNQQDDSEADIRFDFKNEGYFESLVDFNPGSGDFDVDFTLGNYQISGYKDFANKYVEIGNFKGIIDLQVHVKGNTGQPIQASVASKFVLSDFALHDNKDSVMVATNQFRLIVDEVNLEERKLMIDSIRLTRPYFYYEAYDSTSNVAEFMNGVMPPEDSVQQEGSDEEMIAEESTDQADMPEETAESDTTQQFAISINSIVLDSGLVKLADYNNERAFEYEISNIQVSADSINPETTWMDIDMSMKLGDRGKMEGKYLVDMSNPKEQVIDFTISSLMLEDFDVYSRMGTGYPLIYGDMYLKSHSEILNDSIKSQNDVIIDGIKFGRRETVIGPPIKLAMFLLKDKDKVVHFDMPIEGPVGDGATDIGKMVWDQFSGFLGKIVSTPFKFIGSVLNVFDADIKRIKYDYMDSTFTNKMERQLNALLKIEERDPDEVKIDLIFYKDSLEERQQIAMYLVGKEIGSKNRIFKPNDKRFKKYVEGKIDMDTLSIGEACMRIVDRATVNEISAAYDSARFQSVRNYLLSQRDTTDIHLYYSNEAAPNNEDKSPRFEVKLGMKDDYIEEKYIEDKKSEE